ncbi:MAG: DUF2269 family protein [Gemmatimonadota bacterium]
MYNFLKFVHIVSIIIWIGGLTHAFPVEPSGGRLRQAGTRAGLGEQGGALSMIVFMPAVVLTLITGIGLVQVGRLGFGQIWILWGIIGTIVSFIVGGVLTGGTARKLGQQLARGEIDAARAAAVQRRIMVFVILNLLVLFSIVWAMVTKPA